VTASGNQYLILMDAVFPSDNHFFTVSPDLLKEPTEK
jgi:hypothetical protein